VSRYFDNYWKEFKSMRKRPKPDSVLVNLAESIGSTLGTLAAKADAAQRALAKRDITGLVEREGKKLARSARKVVAGARKNATRTVARRKRSGTTRTSGRNGNALRKGKSARVPQRGTIKRAKPRRRMKKARRISPS